MSVEEGQRFAEQHNLLFLETSAKTAVNVEEAFVKTSKIIFDKYQKGIIQLAGEGGSDTARKNSPFRTLNTPQTKEADGGCCAK